MKLLCTLLILMGLSTQTKLFAQFTVPDEDLIMGNGGIWLPRSSGSFATDGVFSNAWIYYNNQHLLYHYETPKGQHTEFYLIQKRKGGDFCGDSCITILCYDSAQSAFVKNKRIVDRSSSIIRITVNYGAGEITTQNDKETHKYYIDVDIQGDNFTGGFHTQDRHSFKAQIPTILAKYKKVEYESTPIDDVPFAHSHINWSKLAIETNGYSLNGSNAKQDSLKLVVRKRYYDSLFSIPEIDQKRIDDSLRELVDNNYWIEFIEMGDTTKAPQSTIIGLLKNYNMTAYKNHFFKKSARGQNSFDVIAGNSKTDWVYYRLDMVTNNVLSLTKRQVTEFLPVMFR